MWNTVSNDVVIRNYIEHDEFLKIYSILLKGKDKLPRNNIFLVNGKLIVRQRPGPPHETLTRRIDRIFEFYLNDQVLVPGGSVRLQYGANSSLEPDGCFYNRHIPPNRIACDVNGVELPSIVIEINSSETYASTCTDETAQVYLNNPGTQVVISIKLVISHSENQAVRGKITQMYFILYRTRDRQPGANRVNPFQVISFGASAHQLSIRAILQHTHVLPERFTGVGRTHGLQCNAPNQAPFQVTIDARDIWYNVPVTIAPQLPRQNLIIDLYNILNFLQSRRLSL